MESLSSLKGRVALVTGSTRGIGWEIARALASGGATVLLNGVSNAAALEARVQELKAQFHITCEGFLFDVADPIGIRGCYTKIHKQFSRLDILVNNAGILDDALAGMITEQMIEKTMSTNMKGVILNLQFASKLMTRSGGGSIINMSSIVGRFRP